MRGFLVVMATVPSALVSLFSPREPHVHQRGRLGGGSGLGSGTDVTLSIIRKPAASPASEVLTRLRMRGYCSSSGRRAGLLEPGDPQNRVISCSSTLVELPVAAASPGRGRLVTAGTT